MMKTAIITGAAGGMGKAYVRSLLKKDMDEVWCLDRTAEALSGFGREFGERAVSMAVDLSSYDELQSFRKIVEEKKPEVRYLVNCAGTADFMPSVDFSDDKLNRSVMVNCTAPIVLSNICIPYMPRGSHIINMSSIGAFTPLPYINLYCAEKAFLRCYSRALNAELKAKGITVTAVCPGWVDTGMLPKEINGKPMKYEGLTQPEDVVEKAILDADAGKDMSIHTALVRWRHILCKLLPQKLCITLWARRAEKYF